MTEHFLSPEIVLAAKQHALREYPKESCGLVVGDRYVPCFNYAVEPEKHFAIASEEFVKAESQGGVRAVLHSHPDGPLYPTAKDMQGQIDTNVPWGIIGTDGERAGDPIMWGDSLPIAPLIGREFRHGVSDCYTLARDTFRLGKEGLAEQSIHGWPYDPITFPEVPRDDCWWDAGLDLYTDHLEKVGFRKIQMSEARIGDACLIKIKSNKVNHAAVLVGNNLLLHHLPSRVSRREAAGIWARHADIWIRYEG